MKSYPITQSQIGVFLECEKYPDSTQYNLPGFFVLPYDVDLDRFVEAWKKLIASKAVMRSRFGYNGDGMPVMQAYDDMPVEIPRRKCTSAEAEAYLCEGFVRPFDVMGGEPLFRIEILETEKGAYIAMDFHHLIMDGFSYSRIAGKELNAFYGGAEKPVEELFFEIAENEKQTFETDTFKEAKDYFIDRFRGAEFVSLSKTGSGIVGKMICESSYINKELCDNWCKEHRVEPSMLFQAAFAHALGVLSRNDSVAYCTAYHGRTDRKKMKATGMFIDNIPILSDVSGDVKVSELISAVTEETAKALSYSVYTLTQFNSDTGLSPKVSFNFRPFKTVISVGDHKISGAELIRADIHSDMNIHIELEGDDYVIFADSSSAVNPPETLLSTVNAIRAAVINMMEGFDKPLKDIPLVTAEEVAEIAALSKGEDISYDKSETWLDLFDRMVSENPDITAAVDEKGSYTYKELDSKGDSVAAYLAACGVGKNDFVIIKTGRCKEYLAAVIGVHKAGAAFVPVDPDYPEDRISYITSDSGASVTLDEETVKKAVSEYPDAGHTNLTSPGNYAYMIYTSGSTGKPKGVIQPQRSLRAFVEWRNRNILRIKPGDQFGQYPSFAFDASLDDTVCPLAGGGTVHILSDELRRDMEGMYDYFKNNNIKGLTIPTQMGMAMLNRYDDLPLEFLMMGGEKLLPFRKTGIRVVNGYGPTEFTVCSSYHIVDQDKDTDIPIGRPVPNTWSLIVDRHGNLLPKYAEGEICLAGPQTAVGYHKLPELSASRFAPLNTFGEVLPDGAVMYHTGDLASYNNENELVYAGRIDFQVKLRGFRIELGEIETRAAAYSGIGAVCAQVRSDRLCLYYTEKEPIDKEKLKAFLSETLTEYMVPTAYIRLEVMPLTPNGKTDLKALPEPEIIAENIVAPENEMQERLIKVTSEFIRTDKFGVENDLVSLGLNSLSAIKLCAALKEKFGVQIKAVDVLKQPTIRAVEALINAGGNVSDGIKAYEKRDFYPLSENQRGVYIDWEMNRDTTQYNIPGVFKYPADMDTDRLAAAISEAADAHSYIKTRLAVHDDVVMQQPHEDEKAEVTVKALDAEPDSAFFRSRIKPFDLFNDRLYTFELYKTDKAVYFFWDIHHIVFDGISIAVFMNDVMKAYRGEKPESEKLTAFDFALYEKELAGSGAFAKAEERYDVLLSEANALIYPDSSKSDGTGASRVIGRISGEGLKAYCSSNRVTPNSFMQAAFAETMHRLTREQNFVFLTVNHGRSASAEFENSVGMFVKTIPLVVNTTAGDHGNMTVSDFIRDIHAQLSETYGMDYYPYTSIVDRYKLRPEVMFVYQGGMEEHIGDQTVDLSLDAVKFPVDVTVYPDSGSTDMLATVEYDGSRYSRHDMQILLDTFAVVAQNMLTAEKIKDVKLLDPDIEADMINGMCKGDVLEFDRSKTWLSMFAENVKRDPDRLAVLDIKGSMTYAELDRLSDSVAHYLVRNNILPDDFVIIKMDRVKEFAAAVIGVHKAGACYVPIDPLYPADRIRYMQEDSEAKVVLTEQSVADAAGLYPDPEPIDLAKPENNAYMIYTSGSTGKPKGAMIPHSALMNYVQFYIRRFGVLASDRISHHITWSFDSHIRDFYPAFAAGAGLYIMPESIRKDPDEIYKFLEKYDITGSAYATAMGQFMLANYDIKQRFVSVGGEALRGLKGGKCKVFNVCGATEVTDVVVDYLLEEGVYYADTPIGKPLANCYAFIVDKYGNLAPQNVAGEICYAGLNVGNGYWHLPEKTKDVFVDCPFVKGLTMYRTGDLGRYNENGDVEYLGRLDFQVKLRGFRIELGEIESNAIHYESMQQVAANVVKDQLCLYYVAETQIDKDKLREFLAASLTEYMVPTVYMQLDSMPMTPSGKINRKALPEPVFDSSTDYVAPETENEKIVAECMKKVLGTENMPGALDNFFTLGGDSIKAIRLVSALRQAGAEVKVPDIMKEKTVRAIAARVVTAGGAGISQEPFSGRTEVVRWFSSIMSMPVPNYYHQTVLLKCSRDIELSKVQKAFDAVVYQHDMLRAVVKDDALFVRPADSRIEIEEYTAADGSETGRICAGIKAGIDMSEALVRAALIHCGSSMYLFIAAHHLVIDGVSWRIILSDLESAYDQADKGSETINLPAKTSTYDDFAKQLRSYRDSYSLSLEIPYWKEVQEKLEKLPVSDQMDFDRKFGTIKVSMGAEDIKRFILSDKSAFGADINDTMLCAVCRSFEKVFGGSSVSVQFEGHGREDIGGSLVTDRTVGWFTSVYPVVIENITGDMTSDMITVKEALHRVPNKGVGYNVLRMIDGEEKTEFSQEKSAMMSFNYLGEIDGEQDGTLFVMDRSIDTGSDRAENNYFGPDIAIDSIVVNGEFTLTLVYNSDIYDKDKAQSFADGIISEMNGITAFLEGRPEKVLTPTDLGENEWSVKEFDAVTEEFKRRGENITRIYPLTPMQESMLLKHITEPDSWAYRLASIWKLDVLPSEETLQKVMDTLAQRHEVLRTAIIHKDVSVSRQAIVERRLPADFVDISAESDKEAAVRRIRADILTNSFDLQDRPLVGVTCAKTSENSCFLIIATHHIIVDGWCMQIFLSEFMQLLSDELSGKHTLLTEPEPAGVYEQAVREILARDKKAGLDYWEKLLADYETRAEIPSYGSVPEAQMSDTDEIVLELSEDTTARLMKICRDEQATISNGVEMLWGLVLSVYSRTNDAVFAKVVSGRDNTDTDVNSAVGLFINSVPVRVKYGEETTVRDMLRELSSQAAASNVHDFCPLSEIQQRTELGSMLLQSVMAYENYNSGNEDADFSSSLSFGCEPVLLKEENFDEINVKAYENNKGQLLLSLTFNRQHYRKAEIERAAELFRVFACAAAEDPDTALCSLPRLSAVGLEDMMSVSYGGDLAYDMTKTWIDMFMAHAKAAPDSIAVVDKSGFYTYAQLDEASENIARYLIANGVKINDRVAVKMSRIKEFAAAVIGANKAGAAYVPIDPEYPEDRIAYMLEDCGASCVLSDENIEEALRTVPGSAQVGTLADPETNAYMIYTSGSTGKPKGVMLKQRAVTACAAWNIKEFGLDSTKRNLHHPSFSFDASTFDLFYPLAAGAQIHILGEEMRKDLESIGKYIRDNGITGATMSTAIGMALLNQYDISLDYIMLGGEKFMPVKKTSTKLYNGYGPTEFTVCSSYHIIDQDKDTDIPIGRAVPNSYSFICDAQGHVLPKGLAGELCLAGTQISEGYWNRPELNRKAFAPLADGVLAGQRVYRTGDLARYNEDNELEYLGRIDSQVKLRGFRIELGEIENQASAFEGMLHVAAEVRKNQLCLYYTAEKDIDRDALREHLSKSLTEYMVPTVYIQLDAMPLTPNGKINRKVLPDPVMESSAEYAAPANETEEIIASAMKKVLGTDSPVGALDSFFELGGDSIKAIRLVSILRAADINVQVSDIMKLKTVRKIAGIAGSSAEAVKISQEPYSGEIPDTAIFRFFNDLELPVPEHFNQSAIFRCRERADKEKLQKAVDALVYQHDMLRAVIKEGKLCVRDAAASIKVEEMRLENASPNEITGACGYIQSHIDVSSALVRIVLLELDDADYLFIAAHHTVIDGVSQRIILSDLEAAYSSLCGGADSVKFPDKTHTYKDYANAVCAYRDSYTLSLEIPYWKKVQEELLKLPTSKGKDHKRTFAGEEAYLSGSDTAKFLGANTAASGLEVNDLLLTAVCRSYREVFDENAVSVQLEGHGREDIGQGLVTDRTVGWFTSVYPVVINGISGNITADIKAVKDTLHRVPNKGVGYNILRFIGGREPLHFSSEQTARIGFNYMGVMDAEQSGSGFFEPTAEIDTGFDFAPENMFGPDLVINCSVKNGSFGLSLFYNSAVCSDSEAIKFTHGILTNIVSVCDALDENTEAFTTPSDLGENEWSAEELEAVANGFAERDEHILRIYPLTPMQEGMLLKHISEPDSFAYRLVSIFELDVQLSEGQLRRAADRLAAKHEVLRTAIIYDGVSVPRQAITDRQIPVTMADLSMCRDKEAAVNELRKEILSSAFDLQNKPLMQLTCAKKDENSCYLLTAVHHSIVDGWCISLYMGDLMRFINEEITGDLTADADYSGEYGRYEEAVREILAKDKFAGLDYWQGLLSDYDTKAEIPSFGAVPAEEQSEDDTVSILIDADTTEKLSSLAREEQATLSNVAELLWGLTVGAYSRSNDVVFAKVVSGRDNTRTDVNDVVGLFINSVPVRIKTDKDSTARTLLTELRKQAAESNKYDFCPLSDIQSRTDLGSDLFQSVIAFENYNSGNSSDGTEGLAFGIRPVNTKEESFSDIDLTVFTDSEERLCVQLTFDRTRYRRSDIQRVLELYRVFAEGIVKSPDAPVLKLPKLGESDTQSVIALSKGETFDLGGGSTWLDLFREQCGRSPDSTAIVDSRGSLTYAQLDDLSDAVAAYLRDKGYDKQTFIAIKIGRNKEFMAAAMGVHKAGAAYVPIDVDYPEDRIAYMLENSGAQLVITDDNITEAINYKGRLREYSLSGDSLAYMIYTSGSTGKPKGVMIRHKSLYAFVKFIRNAWELTSDSRITCHSNFAFDAAVEDLYPVLTAGGTLYIVPEEERRDVMLMRRYIIDNGITGGCYTTQFAQLMSTEEPLKLDYIVLGGEKMTSVPNITGRVINTYGPTEFTVDATYYEIEKDREYNNIPIGRPLYNSMGLVLDAEDRLVPRGMVGELCLAGPQISAGYHKLPEKTAEVFRKFTLPGGEEIDVYHTGDLVRYNDDDELEYFGRIDNQVKLRGFRIELGEIGNAALKFEGISQTAVQIRKENICLYYTAVSEINEDELREFLSKSLAEYMVPTVYMKLDEMPLTPNGKLNLKALPDPVVGSGAEYVKPENELEEKIAAAVGQVLGADQPIGALDNFFALGGDSIKAIRLVSVLRTLDININVADVMKEKTVRGIAAAAGSAEAVAISQDTFRGEVANSAIVNYFIDTAMPVPAHFNQSQILRCREKADIAALQKALNALTAHHDMLRAVYDGEKLIVRGPENRTEIEEKTAASYEEAGRICDDMQTHIDMASSLFRTALIHINDEDVFFVLAHHLIIDGVSWRILVSDLEDAYAQALSGKEIKLHTKTHTYNDYAEALRRYRDSYKLSLEIPYWENVQNKLMSLPASNAKDYSRHFEYTDVSLDEADTKTFMTADATRFNADVNDLILTAVSRSYSEVFGGKEVSVQLEGHGREDIGEGLVTDSTIGWFTSIYPVVFSGIGGKLANDLITVKETLHRVPNKGMGYNVLRFIDGEQKVTLSKDIIAQISFNYLGEMDGEQSGGFFEMTRDITTVDASLLNVTDSDLSVNALVMNGRFMLFLAYNDGIYTAEKAEAFAKGILSHMKEVAGFVTADSETVITATDLGENEWSEEEFENIVREFEENGEKIERIYPLTPMQEGMLFKHISEPESFAYRLVDIYELDVLPTEEMLRRVLDKLAEKHEVLRTAIIHEGVRISRQAITDRRPGLEYVDISGESDKEQAAYRLRLDILRNRFDLQRKPLMHITCAKKDDNSCYLVIAIHHIIVDGWCNQLYLGDLFSYLSEEITGKALPEAEAMPAGSYERAVRELLAKDKRKGLAYWRKLLEDYDTKAQIPHYGEVPENERSKSEEETVKLDADLTERFTKLCTEEQSTIGKGTMLAWGLVLQTYSRTDDAVFVKVVSGRDNNSTDVNNVLGLFINSVPVRVKTTKESTARSMLRELFRQDAQSNEYDFCPLSEIQQQSELGSQLFQTVFAYENYNSGDENEGTLEDMPFGVRPLLIKEEIFDELIPACYMENGRLCMRITYNTKYYRSAEIRRVLDLFEVLIKEMTDRPDAPLTQLSRLSEAQAAEVLKLSTGETMEYDALETWIDIFMRNASETPDKTAVVGSNGSLSYRELDELSDKIAADLCAKGVRENEFIVIKMGRVKEFVAAVIGVQKAGAAYVPIAPEYPPERIAYIAEDSGSKFIIDEDYINEVSAKDISVKHGSAATPETLAYMIYTSGSTGLPKGTMIPHKALLNFVKFYTRQTGQNRDSRVLLHTNFAFDASIKDLVPVFTAGGTLYILSEEQRKDLDLVRSFIVENKITGCNFVTQIAHIITDENICLPMDYMTLGGEKMVNIPNIKGKVINTYGPTEFTVDAFYHEIDKQRSYADIPIGRPIPNLKAYIVDGSGNLVPRGVAGELCLAGVQTARGYNKLPEKTAEVFNKLTLPDGSTEDIYHTGDLCRWGEDGEMYYCGRIDFQVKLRGFRIELGEIESKAAGYDGVRQTVALVKGDRIVLYYTSDTEIAEDKLSKFLGTTLADYMMPGAYVHLDKMPETPNGKVDRKALPDPGAVSVSENVPPANTKEQLFYDAAKEIMPGVEFGVTDNLLELGMTSLMAMKYSSKLHRYNSRIRVSDIMRFGSIRGIINGISRISWYYGDYREALPVLVCVAGIIPVNTLLPKFKAIYDKYNILVIEPASEYYEKFLQNDKFDDLIEFYMIQIEKNVPDSRPAGLLGFSWGGVIAAYLADELSKTTGEKPFLVLGDSYFRDEISTNEEYLIEKAKAMSELLPGSLDDFISRHRVISRLGVSSKKLSYSGRTVYLNALKETLHDENDKETLEFKLSAVRSRFTDAEIIDLKDLTHEDLFTDQSLVPFFTDLLTKLRDE